MSRAMRLCAGLHIYLKKCGIFFLVIFVVQSLLCNTIILFLMWSFSSTVTQIAQAPGGGLMDKLLANPTVSRLVLSGKDGGFSSLIEHTLGRVYVEIDQPGHFGSMQNIRPKSVMQFPQIGTVGVDVSGAGEVLYIVQRLQRWERNETTWTKLVVDIGANDGFLSSNSYNFIRWGWSAILVEPQKSQLDLAKRNLFGYTNQHKDQMVHFENAVLSDYDGKTLLQLSSDVVSMESHVVSGRGTQGAIIDVTCYSVRTFARKYNVPKHFGILSIDAEGQGSKILHQWIKLDYRPLYIIYESLHDHEPVHITTTALENVGYQYLVKKGWNHIYEYTLLT